MSKLKKLTSVVLAATIVSSASAMILPASAAETDNAVSAANNLQGNVQDGVILHAFNWSYKTIKENLPAIAAAGYSTVQTSPVQQPKDYSASRDVTGQWWKLYQPVSLSVAQNSWLGTKDDLKDLCAEAEKYGVKIICDIVSNHMGSESDDNPNIVSSQVKTYDPDIYDNASTFFRNNLIVVSDSSVKNVVQGHLNSCPDLNTNSTVVQDKVISLLKECIDYGVDGFRFDAAKHIETPDDGEYASDYWKNITESAGSYYKAKTGDDLYIYGEILNNCGSGRSYSSYTKYINVTDNRTGDSVLANVVNGKASAAASSSYKSGVSGSDVVLWAESHDTYEGDSGSGGLSNSSKVSDENITKAWAIVAARKDATSLYFARPGASLMGEAAGDTTYKSTAVSEINKFHNLFVGQSEKLGAVDNVAYVARGTSGIVLANCGGNEKSVSISGTGLADGTYTDTVSGAKFTVANGVLTGSIGSTGVAVVYNGTTTPRNTCSVESGDFKGDTLTINLGLDNATSGTYCIDNSTPVTYTGNIAIRVGSDYAYGDTINLTLTATDGKNTTTTTYKYNKQQAASSGVYVFFASEKRETSSSWKAPYNVYIYDEESSKAETYKASNWPGTKMNYDTASGYYYVEVPTTCIATDADGNEYESTFDLAHSANTRVIFSDSSNVNSAPRQYPSSKGLKLNGTSKIFGLTKTTSWEETTLTPTIESQPATEVVRDGKTYKYGDINTDGKFDVQDVTQLQLIISEDVKPSDIVKIISDLNGDGSIDVRDVTMLQMYISGETEGVGNAGKVYTPVQPTQPTNPTKPTEETKPSTEPTTAPAPKTYTLYLKTQLPWMTSMGTNLYAFDNDTKKSYQLEQDTDDYPNVFKADVDSTVTNVTFYRATDMVDEMSKPSSAGPVYNAWTAKVDSTNNCYTLESVDETTGAATATVGPYVKEEAPEWTLDVVYFDNSKTKWKEVYVYGWGNGLYNEAYKMTQIEGTDIWMFELPEPIYPGTECFLFKNTATTWNKQTKNVKAVEGNNLYDGKTQKWVGTYGE
ncbi:alpha-amylase family glycosyl hydrolase [Ruminococcus sp.]|uniref:alpha-amylase family glycosyl hydrolase n=1 Tax=Ruminococcus sp. TaxID=41978 RepID=UPI003863FCBA